MMPKAKKIACLALGFLLLFPCLLYTSAVYKRQHFATAMVMLCRSVELPARFVKGFVTPAAPDDSGVYQVTGRMSHAWAEVYLAGLGWVRFEATPPFNPEWNQSPAQLDASVLEETEYLEEIGVYEPDEDGVGVSSIPENVVSPGSSSLPTVCLLYTSRCV